MIQYSKYVASIPLKFRKNPENFDGTITEDIFKYTLSSEELETKNRLLATGFKEWTKKDLYKFISGIENHGSDMEKISEFMETKTA